MSDLIESPPLQNELCALVARAGRALLLDAAGEVVPAPHLSQRPVLVCHARLTAQRLELDALQAFDVLELFAFVRPAQFCVPTPRGLAQALDLPLPVSAEEEALTLWQAQQLLRDELAEARGEKASKAAAIAAAMAQGGWRWAPRVLQALGSKGDSPELLTALGIWRDLPEWRDPPPREKQSVEVSPATVRQELAALLSRAGHCEPRPEQSDYASAVSAAFGTEPTTVLAEAGTGVGKTLGYLAPALLYAQSAQAPVWLSTYTRNLQRQIEQECARLFPDPAERAARVVVRKGRENYLCLLNYEEAVRQGFATPQILILLGLVARWLSATQDGDLRGGDFPGWLPDLLGRNRIFNLADRRGECLHGACVHYNRCFIERSVRAARSADLVIANHALIMSAAARGGVDEQDPPDRFVFDEGHHVFHAADSAFGCDLTGQSGAELRRWLLGGEGRSKGRVRGLARRAEPLLPNSETGLDLLERIKQQATLLPGEGWRTRLTDEAPRGTYEELLCAIRLQILALNTDAHPLYALEAPATGLPACALEKARALADKLEDLQRSVRALMALFTRRLEQEVELDGETRSRIGVLLRTLTHTVQEPLTGWQAMLQSLCTEEARSPEQVDWLGLERVEGALLDVGVYRRYLDPTKPFADTLGAQAHGLVLTSATLTDPGAGAVDGWEAAEAQCGTLHLPKPALRARVPSPFDYAAQTRVLVVTDVPSKNEVALAQAYEQLFIASGGGALGLFTAIERLKRVQAALGAPLSKAGLPLYSQHVDGLDPHTLIDIFRAEGNACLLGTDAIRDGVDVPGRALRLLVFDKIPWPRTDLLMTARKRAFGGSAYAERLTRQKLRQAFGRLIRTRTDHGVFILLSPLPSRLASAFPGIVPQRVTLAEAVEITRDFVK